jgi:hypothetical protein
MYRGNEIAQIFTFQLIQLVFEGKEREVLYLTALSISVTMVGR